MSAALEVEMIAERTAFDIYEGAFSLRNHKGLTLTPESSEEDTSSQDSSESEISTETPPPTPVDDEKPVFPKFNLAENVPVEESQPITAELPRVEEKRLDTKPIERPPNEFEPIDFFTGLKVYFAWSILCLFGLFREFLVRMGLEKEKGCSDELRSKGFVPLYNDFDSMYIRRMYIRVRDVFERPIGSCPGATVNCIDRYSEDGNWSYKFPGTQTEVINMASYNYLGFAQTDGPCAEAALNSIDEHGLSVCSNQQERGMTSYQRRLEDLVAEFLGVEDAICFSMGFATNSLNIAALADKDTLLISDQKNHASLILGMRMARATAKVFPHNDVKKLEEVLVEALAKGNPKTKRPYSKIIIVVEGIYSMEGSICPLPEIIALKNKYKAYLYLDEAHSIGAMGETGKGVVEYWGCNAKDVDIMMGTFTKSFGAAGGYIAGTKEVIDHIRTKSAAGFYSAPMSPPVAEQIHSSMTIIMGRDETGEGAKRIERLARNSRYFRLHLKKMGYILYGSDDSPVVPMLLYVPAFVGYFGREMLKRRVGIVVVSYPACEMVEARARFCLSAAHTKEQLDEVLGHLRDLADNTGSRFSRKTHLYKNLQIEW